MRVLLIGVHTCEDMSQVIDTLSMRGRQGNRLPPRIGEIFGGKKLCFFTQTLVRALKKRRLMRVWRRHLQRRLNANERLSSYRLNKQSLINSLEAEVNK